MGFCFYKYGILPNKYRELNDTDKILMLSALDHFSKQEEKARKKKK